MEDILEALLAGNVNPDSSPSKKIEQIKI